MYVIILVKNSAGIFFYNVQCNFNDVRMFSIEPVKKTNVPSGLH